MTIQLPEDVATAVEAAVRDGRFASVDDALAEAWRRFERQRRTPHSEPAAALATFDPLPGSMRDDADGPDEVVGEATEMRRDDEGKPIWERILERTARIPDEEWDKLPADLAEQHDHYLYGTPKRPTR